MNAAGLLHVPGPMRGMGLPPAPHTHRRVGEELASPRLAPAPRKAVNLLALTGILARRLGAHGLPLDAEYTPPLPSQTRSRGGAHPAVFGCIRLGSSPVCRCCEDGMRDTVLPPSHLVSS